MPERFGKIFLFIVLMVFAAVQHVPAQDEIRVAIALNNAAQYYQKGQPGKALQILDKIRKRYPDHPQLNYYLAILYFHVLGDKVGAEEFYKKARQQNPRLIDPQLLSPEQIRKIFTPIKINEQTINLRLVLKRVRQLFLRNAFKEARTALLQAETYLDKADEKEIHRYYLYTAYTYMRLDSLYQAAYYFHQLNRHNLDPQEEKLYREAQQTIQPFLDAFYRRYRKPNEALQLLNETLQQNNYPRLQILIDLLMPIIKPDHPAYFPLMIYRLQVLVHQRNVQQGLAYYQRVKAEMEKAGVFQSYRDRMVNIFQQLTLQSIQRQVGNQSAMADSLMLKGKYDAGWQIYQHLLAGHEGSKPIEGYLYYQLAKIHLTLGKYALAKKFIKKAGNVNFSKSLLEELATDVVNGELFEEEWHQKYRLALDMASQNAWSHVRAMLLPLLESPYLRLGLKAPTLMLLARAYNNMGKIPWAIQLAENARLFSNQPDSITQYIEQLKTIKQENRFVQIPKRRHKHVYLVTLLYRGSVEFKVFPLYKFHIYGKGGSLPPFSSYSSGTISIKGGGLYRIEYDRKIFLKRAMTMGEILAFTQFYLSFR